MWSLIAIPLTCWLCALVALPRKPRLGNEVEELVYTRLLGRHHFLVLLALLATAVLALTFIVSLPRNATPELQAVRATPRVCTHPTVGFPTCYEQQADGTWTQEAMQDDGTWVAYATVSAPDGDATP
jgi:hypothetical protein